MSWRISELAGGRSEPKAYIGYVFLFFYGLERRLLIDGQRGLVPEQERLAIVEEIKRLLQLYGENRSFRGYATNLLATEWVLYQRNTKLPDYIDIHDRYCSKPFEVLLARYVAAGKKIPASMALHWLILHPDFGLRTPARRCEKEFKALFFSRYGGKFGEGITIAPNKTPLKLDYHPASPSIPRNIEFPDLNLPNPFNLKSPLKKIAELAESCTSELEAYSRYLGRKDSEPRSLTGLSLMPKEVLNRIPAADKLKERLALFCAGGYRLITVTDLYRNISKEPPATLTKKDSETLALFLEKLDFGIAPDVRFHHIKPGLEGSVVIFPYGHGIDFSPSGEFQTLTTIIRLGAIVSQADQKVSDAEKNLLSELINDNRDLTGIEKDSLSAFLFWCLNVPQNIAGLKQRLAEVDSAGKEAVRRLLVSLAHADGVIDPQEVKQLEKLYTTLGLDKTDVVGDIHSLAANDEPVTVSTQDADTSSGQARNLHAELMRNVSTRTKPDGNALTSVVERFITEARKQADAAGTDVHKAIEERLAHLSELVGGYDFAKVVAAYWQGYEQDNEQLKQDAVRWLRGEFPTKTDARKALDVRTIVDDTSVYDHFKLLSLFVRQAGYKGLLVNLDEMVNLYKLSSQKARVSNYEQILRMLNDCLQGTAEHLGFLLAGTPEFLLDPRKGLYSYEALHSRLAENTFAQSVGVVDYSGPTLHLANLVPEELLILLRNLRHVFASGNPEKYLLPDDALTAFLAHCSNKIGDAYFRTPRNTIKAFVDLLAILEQNPSLQWTQLIEQVHVTEEQQTDMPEIEDAGDDELTSFKL